MASAGDVKKEQEMLKKDIYTMLSIEKTATDKEVKKAYRQRALKLHPDKNPNDKNAAAKFDELQQIYDWIMEPQNRAKFDMHLENRQKVEVRRKAMDSALQKRRDDLERREKEAQSGEMASEAKKLSRKEQILRLRAEGVNLLEEEQAKWRLNKKERSECCRLKVWSQQTVWLFNVLFFSSNGTTQRKRMQVVNSETHLAPLPSFCLTNAKAVPLPSLRGNSNLWLQMT